ncbi:hypothetical protein, partial [Verminephrobacter aporrectodeae]|uniref:hypothetical protein n=1 Tax=Verminephrobacter aporrectodeae TaxID=1110389 RepID=UPI0022449438
VAPIACSSEPAVCVGSSPGRQLQNVVPYTPGNRSKLLILLGLKEASDKLGLGVSLLGALLSQGIQPPPGGFDSAEGFATAFSAALQPLFWVSALVCSIAGVAALGMPQALFPSRTHERLQ